MSVLNDAEQVENDLLASRERVAEWNRLWDFRLRLKKLNSEKPTLPKDSSIKKVNAFLRKLKTLNDHTDNIDSLCSELQKLRLSKFIAEIVSIISETKITRKAEIEGLAKICSCLNQEYVEFSGLMETKLLRETNREFKRYKKLSELEAEEKEGDFLRKQRQNLRLLAELIIIGVFPDDALMVDLLNSLVKQHKIFPSFIISKLLAQFFKFAGEQCSGRISKEILDDLKALETDSERVTESKRRVFEKTTVLELEKIVTAFYEREVKLLEKICALKIKTKKALIKELKTEGALNNKQMEKLKKTNDSFFTLFDIIYSMSISLCLEFPKLEVDENERGMTIEQFEETFKQFIKNDSEPICLFESDEQRAFYENLHDISMYLPTEKIEITETKGMIEQIMERVEIDENSVAGIDLIFNEMKSVRSKEKIDTIAEKYAPLHCEKNLVKLIRSVLYGNKKAHGQIVFYSRLLATLSKHFPEIKCLVNEILEQRFFAMFFKKGRSELSDKLMNIAFIAELSKFSFFPLSKLSNIIKKCLDDFSSHSIQSLSELLEVCGRWMFKNPVTSNSCQRLLKKIRKKMQAEQILSPLESMLEMACRQCDPPPVERKPLEKLPPEKAFIRHLIFERLREENVNEVLRMLRKMNWADPSIFEFFRQSFFSVVSFSFAKLSLLASILAALERYYDVCGRIIDEVLEEIHQGLEDGEAASEQRQIALLKFLGEAYVYRIVSSQVIFDVLYLVLTFLPEGVTSPSEFRIRLVIALLQSCGRYFRKGSARKRMKRFLVYFERLVKVVDLQRPLDVELEFLLDEVFDFMQPRTARYKSLEEVQRVIEEMEGDVAGHRDLLIAKSKIGDLSHIFNEEEKESEEESEEEEIEVKKENVQQKENGEEFKREAKKKTEDDFWFEKELDSMIKSSIELNKYDTKMMTINNAKSYVQKMESQKSTGRKMCFLVKRKGDSKPVFREIVTSQDFFVIGKKEDEEKEKKILKENVIKRIIESEMNERMQFEKKK